MELNLNEAVQQIQSMFNNFDPETIRTVLAANSILTYCSNPVISVTRWPNGKDNRRSFKNDY